MRARGILTLLAFAALPGCEMSRWQHPTLPEERWTVDRQHCIAAAYADARQRYDDSYLTRDTHLPGDQGHLAQARRNELRDRQMAYEQRALERCMTEKGYQRVPVSQQPSKS